MSSDLPPAGWLVAALVAACGPTPEPLVADTTAALASCAPLFDAALGDDVRVAATLDAATVTRACADARTLYDRHATEVSRSRAHAHLVADAARLGDDVDFALRSLEHAPAAVPLAVAHVRAALLGATTTRDTWPAVVEPFDAPASTSDWARALASDAQETDGGMDFLRRYAFEQDVDPDQVRRRLLTVHGARHRATLDALARAGHVEPPMASDALTAWRDAARAWSDTYDRIVTAYVAGDVRTQAQAAQHVADAAAAHTRWRAAWKRASDALTATAEPGP